MEYLGSTAPFLQGVMCQTHVWIQSIFILYLKLSCCLSSIRKALSLFAVDEIFYSLKVSLDPIQPSYTYTHCSVLSSGFLFIFSKGYIVEIMCFL